MKRIGVLRLVRVLAMGGMGENTSALFILFPE